ncbi:MAG: glycine cleavage system protein H [Hydrogenophaga sp.]|jgi:glycine cleavage system H protein|uniref:glycine cleavage system protein H n=1 Tax=Hydrogenophaga sp. TaxID=1904254 RepID=UPI001D76B153|nr:glycine cleavage system protein H [Hydrogenophaga sp.]MBW0172409.1 glycine cleavage system protein H [Hydrogenophaga sp.]MBW0186313.1 glycine cleavage system protein H [Hydrogenophaga sp.]
MNALNLPFPDDLHYLVEHQVWARLDGDDLATVGITSLGIQLAGEIYMCRPKTIGSAVEQGRSIAVVELAKSIVSVKSPLSGAVVAVNPRLATKPELVHLDPYGEGWLAQLRVADAKSELAALVHGDAVAPAMQHHAWLHRQEQGEG